MAVYVNRMARFGAPPQELAKPAAEINEPKAPMGGRIRPIAVSVLRFLWSQARNITNDVLYGTGGGLNDSAFPSGYSSPHKRGSRGVRNLWHQPF